MRDERSTPRRGARWPVRLSCALAGGALVAGGLALAPGNSSKERMHEDMLNLALQIEGLKAQGATGGLAGRRLEKLMAQYAQLRAALGGDEPADALAEGGAGNPVPVGAPATPPPPGCASVTATFSAAPLLPIPATAPPIVVSSVIPVAGLPTFLWDLNVTLTVPHTFAGDLDVTLASPAGTIVTLTTDNGAGNDNVFVGSFFGDDSDPDGQVPYATNDGLVTDGAYVNLVPETPVVPEEAFAAFIGEDPNGDWLLTISDDANLDGGSFDAWTLEITALDKTPVATSTVVASAPAIPIPPTAPPNVISDTITVSGLDTFICDVNLTTFIAHTFCGDIDMTLMSPAGTVVTITTDNGGGNDNVYLGTLWDDDADPDGQVPYANNDGLANDSLFANLVVETPLVPEDAFAAFMGEDPNGPWTLTISDDANLDGGSLDSWSLEIVTCVCPAQPGEVQFYTDPVAFDLALVQAGKVPQTFWNFDPHDLPPAVAVPLDDLLDINSHGLDPDDPWTTVEGDNLWPPAVDNVQFSANEFPQQKQFQPHGIDGLAFATPGFAGNNNNVLVANNFYDSFNIISGPPAGDNHTAIGVEVVNFFVPDPLIVVTVFDKEGLAQGTFELLVPQGQKAFLGILRKDRETIGRVDIWSPAGGFEGISAISLWQNPELCPWDINGDGVVNIVDLIALLGAWGPGGGPADFDGDGDVDIVDLIKLLANWGPCPGSTPANCDQPATCGNYAECNAPGCVCFTLFDGSPFCGTGVSCDGLVPCAAGACPPGFVCQVGTCCGIDICVPVETKCPAPAGAAPRPPQTGLTTAGPAVQ